MTIKEDLLLVKVKEAFPCMGRAHGLRVSYTAYWITSTYFVKLIHTIVNSFLPHFAICMQVALYQIMNTVPLICPDKKCLLKQVLRSAKTVVRTLMDVNILRIGPKMGHVTFKILLLWQKSRLVPYPDPPDVVT